MQALLRRLAAKVGLTHRRIRGVIVDEAFDFVIPGVIHRRYTGVDKLIKTPPFATIHECVCRDFLAGLEVSAVFSAQISLTCIQGVHGLFPVAKRWIDGVFTVIARRLTYTYLPQCRMNR